MYLIIEHPSLVDESLGYEEGNINKGYSLSADPYNIKINRVSFVLSGKNKGKLTHETVGYYNNLRQALQKMVEFDIQNNLTKDLAYIENRLVELKLFISKVVKDINYGEDSVTNFNRYLTGG